VSGSSLPAPPPEARARLLPPDVDLVAPARASAARPVWLGMVWSRLGRCDLAWAFWDRVAAREVQPWVAAERGRVLRELGLHDEAERVEWPALAAVADPVDHAMLRVSLVADAVGRGDLDGARRRLQAARDAVAGLADQPRAARQRLRLTWVAVEVAWAIGAAPGTDGLPTPDGDGTVAWPADLAHGSDFHRAKALLFGGLVHRSPALLDRAAAIAPPMLAWAVHLARADQGADGALASARVAWGDVVVPPGLEGRVAGTTTAVRLGT
jgi:hypothetical protein